MSAPRPIEIVGGGLAGLSLGLALRRAEIPVTIFEAGDYPRHRVCGEFITGLSLTTIHRLGLLPFLADAVVQHELAWFLGDGPARVQKLPRAALGLSRHALDARLAEAFEAAGGTLVRHARVVERGAKPGRVFATGRRAGRSTWLGLKFHARDFPLTRDLELHLGQHAYVGLSRVEAGAVNVCGLFRRRPLARRGPELMFEYLRACGLNSLAARLRAAVLDAESFCAVAALDFDRRVPRPRTVALGDACATIPPFTGNGMAMAFQSAEVALPPLTQYARHEIDWPAAAEKIGAALRKRFRLRLASAHALHPFLLRPQPQRWFAALNRLRLLPFRSLYAALH